LRSGEMRHREYVYVYDQKWVKLIGHISWMYV